MTVVIKNIKPIHAGWDIGELIDVLPTRFMIVAWVLGGNESPVAFGGHTFVRPEMTVLEYLEIICGDHRNDCICRPCRALHAVTSSK